MMRIAKMNLCLRAMFLSSALTLLITLNQQPTSTHAFTTSILGRVPSCNNLPSGFAKGDGTFVRFQERRVLFSSPEEEQLTGEESKNVEEPSVPSAVVSTQPATSPPSSSRVEETPSYPIDLPSPILLATSMVLAIVGTGSGFDLANDTPRYGFGVTFSIATVSLVLSIGLFYASILKAKAETDADDQEYMRGK
mmetsp:Transcript_6101/g.11290  ORF Transcript_6101/g.11290 Transcript_6101/m.11290 type:complete len:194 (-) Transcript_6101:157-738(-)